MEINKKPDPPQNRVKKIQKIRELFCRLISDGTVQEVETFLRYFQKDLENPVWPVLKGPFTKNVPIESFYEPVFALKNGKEIEMFHIVLSRQPDFNVRDLNRDRITALHGVVLSDEIMPAAMFLYYGFDPDARTKSGDRPYDKARSESMRQMFRDFEQLDRQAFALKYKLNVPKEQLKTESDCETLFPFTEMPTDLQREVILKLELVDLLLAPLVCKKWNELASKQKNSVVPKLGKHFFWDNRIQVSLQIQLFPTVFHFALVNSLTYNPLKHNTDFKYPSEFPFNNLVADSASEEETVLHRLKQLIRQKKYPVYGWNYPKDEIFIKLMENGGLGVILKYIPRKLTLD